MFSRITCGLHRITSADWQASAALVSRWTGLSSKYVENVQTALIWKSGSVIGIGTYDNPISILNSSLETISNYFVNCCTSFFNLFVTLM